MNLEKIRESVYKALLGEYQMVISFFNLASQRADIRDCIYDIPRIIPLAAAAATRVNRCLPDQSRQGYKMGRHLVLS